MTAVMRESTGTDALAHPMESLRSVEKALAGGEAGAHVKLREAYQTQGSQLENIQKRSKGSILGQHVSGERTLGVGPGQAYQTLTFEEEPRELSPMVDSIEDSKESPRALTKQVNTNQSELQRGQNAYQGNGNAVSLQNTFKVSSRVKPKQF